MSAEKVYIEGGSDLNLKPGDEFQLLRRGDEIRNSNGELLGFQEQLLGRVKVRSVHSKMTIADVLEITEGEAPQIGDLVRLPD